MKDFNESHITIQSIKKSNSIITTMENKTFHNHYHILYDLCTFLNKENIVYLEIGAFAGGSASLIASHPSVSQVFSIDIGVPIHKEIPIRNVNKYKHANCNYTYIEGDSRDHNVIESVYKMISEVDILFIDGNHTYDAVIADFNNYKKLVNTNGFIIFDDYLDSTHSPEVRPAVDHIVSGLDGEYEIVGSLSYDLLRRTNTPHLASSNDYILRKL